jgi:septal ring factor EnvC (AmiA/AmiB activator)
MKIKFIFSALLISAVLNAVEITGIGYGDTQKESLKNALSSLSNRISVVVKSEFETKASKISDKFKKDTKQKISLTSNLPIKGAKFSVLNGPRLAKTTAIINTKYSLPSYESELKRLEKNINYSLKKLSKEKDKAIQYDILGLLLNDIENFNKHKVVAILLNGKNLPTLKTTLSFVSPSTN